MAQNDTTPAQPQAQGAGHDAQLEAKLASCNCPPDCHDHARQLVKAGMSVDQVVQLIQLLTTQAPAVIALVKQLLDSLHAHGAGQAGQARPA